MTTFTYILIFFMFLVFITNKHVISKIERMQGNLLSRINVKITKAENHDAYANVGTIQYFIQKITYNDIDTQNDELYTYSPGDTILTDDISIDEDSRIIQISSGDLLAKIKNKLSSNEGGPKSGATLTFIIGTRFKMHDHDTWYYSQADDNIEATHNPTIDCQGSWVDVACHPFHKMMKQQYQIIQEANNGDSCDVVEGSFQFVENEDCRTTSLPIPLPSDIQIKFVFDDQTEFVDTDDQTEFVDTDDQTEFVDTDDQTEVVDTDDQTEFVDTDDQTESDDIDDQLTSIGFTNDQLTSSGFNDDQLTSIGLIGTVALQSKLANTNLNTLKVVTDAMDTESPNFGDSNYNGDTLIESDYFNIVDDEIRFIRPRTGDGFRLRIDYPIDCSTNGVYHFEIGIPDPETLTPQEKSDWGYNPQKIYNISGRTIPLWSLQHYFVSIHNERNSGHLTTHMRNGCTCEVGFPNVNYNFHLSHGYARGYEREKLIVEIMKDHRIFYYKLEIKDWSSNGNQKQIILTVYTDKDRTIRVSDTPVFDDSDPKFPNNYIIKYDSDVMMYPRRNKDPRLNRFTNEGPHSDLPATGTEENAGNYISKNDELYIGLHLSPFSSNDPRANIIEPYVFFRNLEKVSK